MTICFGPDFSECIEIIRNHEFDNYIQCTFTEDHTSLIVQEVNSSLGEFESFKAKKAKKKREKHN